MCIAGATIYMHDFSCSLRDRAASRKLCGPYKWTVPAVRDRNSPTRDGGRRFYFDANGGISSFVSLRIEDAKPYSRNHATGYYGDDFGDMVVRPYIIRLPHGRGFLAAAGESADMWGYMDFGLHADEREASFAAHELAERLAERHREANADQEPQDGDDDLHYFE